MKTPSISLPLSLLVTAAGLSTLAGAGALFVTRPQPAPAPVLAPEAAPASVVALPPTPADPARSSLARGPARVFTDDERAALRAAAAERAAAQRRALQFDRDLREGEWLRVLSLEVAGAAGLQPADGEALSAILLSERDAQRAVWERLRDHEPRAEARRLLPERMAEVRARRDAELEARFGPQHAADLRALLDQGGAGVEDAPGALARAGGGPRWVEYGAAAVPQPSGVNRRQPRASRARRRPLNCQRWWG